jgi:acyl dehydratase
MGELKTGWTGRYFEDFSVGDVYRSRLGRTISEADNTQFTLLTNNSNQIHFNAHYAEKTEFKRLLVNSALTLSIVAGMAVIDVSENGFALGWDYIKLPNPVYPGDTLYAETEIVTVRESKSRPTQGIVKVRTSGINQDGATVIEFERSVMVWKRDHAPRMELFPERPAVA